MIGDVIRFNGSFGTVEAIGLRSTRIRLLNGDIVYQPNMDFIAGKVENVSVRSRIRREMNLTIPYDTSLEKVEEAIEIVGDTLGSEQVASDGRFDMDALPPRVSFNEFNDSNLNIRADYWFGIDCSRDSGWYEYLEHCELVNLEIARRFEAAGIEFAFPSQTLYLAGDPSRPLPATEGVLAPARNGDEPSAARATASSDRD
jgi:MscS family membrane protein